MFTEPFMIRALLATLFLAPLCALLGVFVTARRMAFFSDTISHAALAGVALGFWLGLANPTVPLFGVSLLVAAAIYWLRENTELLTDTIMALLLAGSVAVGIVILSLLRSRPADIQGYLFGDVLAIGWPDVWLAAALFTVLGTLLFVRLNELSLITAQEELAHVCGVPVRRLNYLFVIVLTLTVAITIRLLGIILVTSLLVIPPAAARSFSRNLRQQILLSLAVGLVGGLGGILVSYQLDVPCGPAIVLTCIALFLISLLLGGLTRKRILQPIRHAK
jgi:ABC-type Mn2+/Zn2+ transport system permease subunit